MATIRLRISLLRVVWMRLLLLYRPVWRLRLRRRRGIRLTRIVSSLRTALTSSQDTLTSAISRLTTDMRRRLRFLKTPQAQLLSAIGGMVGGAWLIGWWMVGIVLMVGSVAWGADAFLRDDSKKSTAKHETVLERYRRAA